MKQLQSTSDLHIRELKPLISPAILMEELPLTKQTTATVDHARKTARDIILGNDHRILVIAGPCSVHDPKAALEYAEKLASLAKKHHNELFIIMRVYFEKPRTTIGWKGLINDPTLNNSFNVNIGLRTARKLLLDINELGLASGTEFLDTIIPQFIGDLISWGAIGARTTESQIHRELASGLSCPVGFKNGTTGNINIAIDAIAAAQHPHHFLGVTKHGIPAIVATTGNNACHVILRGSSTGPNYDSEHIKKTKQLLEKANLTTKIMVDCSHGNSNKDYTRQHIVVENIAEQLADGETAICGIMLESNLVAGKQPLKQDHPLTYGQSITDACIDLRETEKLLGQLASVVKTEKQT